MAFSTIAIPSKDVQAAKAFYEVYVGAAPVMDESYYVGFQVGDIHLGLIQHLTSSSDGIQVYWDTPDIKDHLERLVAAGGTIVQEPNDVGGGMLVGTIKDSNGSVVGLRQLPTA